MRAYQVGPGSSRSTWKATLDPGKNLPCSNSGHPVDPKSLPTSQSNAQATSQQQTNQEKQ